VEWAHHSEDRVDERQVDKVVAVGREPEEALGPPVLFARARAKGGEQSVKRGVHTRESVSGTGHDFEELGEREEEIGDLRKKEEAEGLGEVAMDADHGEGHAGKIAKGVTHEGPCGIEVVVEESEDDPNEGEDEREGKNLGGTR
jgi:hypothetical protein